MLHASDIVTSLPFYAAQRLRGADYSRAEPGILCLFDSILRFYRYRQSIVIEQHDIAEYYS